MRRLGWLLCGLGALSCSGKAFRSFSGDEASGGAAAGGLAGLAGAGSGFLPGGGAAGASIAVSDAGASAASDAGASATGGAGVGNSGEVDCAALHGEEFGGHCYVDATVESSSAQQAVMACLQLASEQQVVGHLLVLDSAEEQGFVLKKLLVPFTDVSDAWLGLTCNQLDHPDINDCYCSACSKSMLAEKQRAWAWLAGEWSDFGWINGNPNGGYRCAALAYNPDLTIWGSVDRPCDKVSFSPMAGHTHGYRTVCELEP